MKKLMILILSGMLLLLSACAPSTGEVKIDLDALADRLLESESFGEALNPVDDGIAEAIYNIENASSARLYVGSGAVADELALFQFEDEAAAQEAAELARARVENQRESFADYIPEEVPKLDNAVVKSFGRCLVVCISSNAKARDIISDFMEQEG